MKLRRPRDRLPTTLAERDTGLVRGPSGLFQIKPPDNTELGDEAGKHVLAARIDPDTGPGGGGWFVIRFICLNCYAQSFQAVSHTGMFPAECRPLKVRK